MRRFHFPSRRPAWAADALAWHAEETSRADQEPGGGGVSRCTRQIGMLSEAYTCFFDLAQIARKVACAAVSG